MPCVLLLLRGSPCSRSSLPPFRAQLTPPSFPGCLASLLDFFWALVLEFGSPGNSLPSCRPPEVHRPSPSRASLETGASLAVRLRGASREIVEEVGEQSVALGSATTSQWELVEDGSAIPGAPKGFLVRDVQFSFEEGPPPTPSFCIEAAKRHLTSSRFSAEERARSAFAAGHWARAFWESRASYRSTYRSFFAGCALDPPERQWV